MREGTFIRRFTAKDGRRVTLRAPRWSDLDDMLEFINSMVDEGADILMDRTMTREGEVDYLARHLADVEKGEKIAVVAEVDERFVGQVDVRCRSGRSRHVGNLGISFRKGYRDVGIGTELMREAEAQARSIGIRLITLEVFEGNSRALHLYDKVGYRIVGRIPKAIKKNETNIDSIIMAKEIQPL